MDLITIKPVRDFLLQTEIFDQLEGIVKKYKIKEDRVGEFLDLTDAVVRGKLDAKKMPILLGRAFGLDDSQAQKLAADISGYALLPLEHYLLEIKDQIIVWGGQIEDYPDFRVKKELDEVEKLSPVQYLAKEMDLNLPEHLMKRFEFIARSFAEGQRDEAAVKKALMRPIDVGGLGFKEEMVAPFITWAKSHKEQILGKESDQKASSTSVNKNVNRKKKEVKNQEEKIIPSKKQMATSPKKQSILPPLPPDRSKKLAKAKEQKERKIQESKKSSVLIAPEPLVFDSEQVKTQQVKKSEKKKTQKQKKSQLPAKTKTHDLAAAIPVISGGHNPFEEDEKEIEMHKQKLEQRALKNTPVNSKDLISQAYKNLKRIIEKPGMTENRFHNIALLYIRGIRELHHTEKLLKKDFGYSGEIVDRIMTVLGKIKKQVEKSHRKKKLPSNDNERKYIHQKEKDVLNKRHAVLTNKVHKESIDPILPHARVSAARPKAEEQRQQQRKIDAEVLRKVQSQALPKKARAQLTKESLPPGLGEDRPAVKDIVYSKTLEGPVEELLHMTLEDFRRLSSDPQEAARKIDDKYKLLEEISYEDRMKGIRAWRKSVVYNVYVEMMRRSLSEGMSISEVASKMRSEGKGALNPAEVKALMKLHQKMGF